MTTPVRHSHPAPPGRTPYPGHRNLADLVAAQATASPDAIAVADESTSLTYAELIGRAFELAGRLGALGIGPEAVVGVSLDRTVDLVVGLLGILVAGGAYLPLDPDFPEARLAFMVEDAGSALILTEDGLLPPRVGPGVRRVGMADQRACASASAPAAVPRPFHPEQLAYVLYTSGSTGRPKGVEIPHRALVNFLWSMARRPGLRSDDTLLALTTLSFDIAALELWLPLTRGARVVIASRRASGDPVALAGLMETCRPTVVQATPATWRMLTDAGWRPWPGLTVLCGGEALPPALARLLLDGGAELWNLYGPTEATVWSTVARLWPGEPVHVGRPIANTTAHVLDDGLAPVAPGSAGELYLGGDGLARGYRGRPDLTADRFIAHPLAAGGRLYRTGDLARCRPDGNIDVLGRIDHQVKVRGFRIECGEVEAALEDHPGVQAAVVVARTDGDGDQRLVGYVVPADGQGRPASDALRAHLRGRLPAYMVPSAFVALDAFPLTPNRKVDRAALPAPGPARPEELGSYVAPATPEEHAVCAAFALVLGIEPVGTTDDFFALGGHSLLAVAAAAELRRRLGVGVAANAVFDAPTPAALACLLATDDAREPPLVRTDASTGPLSLVQEQMWRLRSGPAGPGAFNDCFEVRFDGPFEPAALDRALAWLALRHESLRTRFGLDRNGVPYQHVAPSATIPLETTDLRGLDDQRRAQLLEARRAEHEHIAVAAGEAPLCRADAYLLDATTTTVVLTLDHLICDETSLTILATDLADAHGCASGTTAAAPPHPPHPPPVRYVDYACWERGAFSACRLDQERVYWRRTLAGMPVRSGLPYDRRPPATAAPAGTVGFAVPAEASAALAAVGRANGVTQYVLAVAAVSALITRWTGRDDVVLLTTVDGRDRPELQGVVGDFANVGLLRTDLSGDPTFETVLARARAGVVGLFGHRHLPFLTVRDDLLAACGDPDPEVAVSVEFFHAVPHRWTPGASIVAVPPADGSGRRVDPLARRRPVAANPLSFWVLGDGSRLWGSVRYHPGAFHARTAEGVAIALEGIFAAAAADPAVRISALPVPQ